MKKIAIVLATLAVSAVSASAADMAFKARPVAVAALPSWTGFYVGINGGAAAMSDPSMSYVDGAVNAIVPFTVSGSSSVQGLGGFHLGYNYQMPNNWIVGIEGDWDWTNLKSGASTGLLCSGPPFRGQCGGVRVLTDNAFLQTEVNWLASIRGRLGYSWNNQWMLYATAGVAFTETDYTGNLNCTGIPATFCGGGAQAMRVKSTTTRVGAVLGAGAEFKPVENWVLGAEYLYYRFDGDDTASGGWTTVATGAPAPFFECTVPGQNCGAFTYRGFDVHTGRVRLSYKFN